MGATESILECIVGEYCVLCIVLIILLYFFRTAFHCISCKHTGNHQKISLWLDQM